MRHVVAVDENSGQSLRSLVNAVAHAIPKVTVFAAMRGRQAARGAAGYGPESEHPIGSAAASAAEESQPAVMGRGQPGAGPRRASATDSCLDDFSEDCAGA
jgi:hypothetical protein